MDNPPCFSATFRPSYVVRLAADKQVQAVQEATVLRSRDYTKAGIKDLFFHDKQKSLT
jgi:hypothetical protein